MRWPHVCLAAACGSTGLLHAPRAHAELITFTFGGFVTEIYDPQGFWGNSIPFGTSFAGSYTFDSDASNPAPGEGLEEYDNVLTAFSLQVGPHHLIGTGLNDRMLVGNYPPPEGDLYYVQDGSAQLVGRQVGSTLSLHDPTGTAFTSVALPVTPPDLALFQERDLLILDDFTRFWVGGTVTSLAPEPCSLALLLPSALLLSRPRRA